MKISSKFSLALLAGTILSTPTMAAAATLTPTLDTIKAEAANISGSYALTELSGELPAGAAEVEIAGVKYYFTPEGEDAALLATLAGTSAGNLIEAADGIFELNGKKYSFNTAAIPESVFEYEAGTAEDYNFTMQEADAEGNITTKYYKVVLKPETFATSENIKWGTTGQIEIPTIAGMPEGAIIAAIKLIANNRDYFNQLPDEYREAFAPILLLPPENFIFVEIDNKLYYYSYEHSGFLENSSKITWKTTAAVEDPGMTDSALSDDNQVKGVVKVDLPNNKSEYYEYTYTKPTEYEIVTAVPKDFKFNESGTTIHQDGGAAINNPAGKNYGNINNKVFANNKVTGSISGGTSSKRNYLHLYGGAIYNAGEMGNINADFINNSVEVAAQSYSEASASGGAIYNAENATISDITGDFIGNYTQNDNIFWNPSSGGAIGNDGSIGNIIGDFIGNYTDEEGGAIGNDGTISTITGDFIGNHANNGGAIYNLGTIGDIAGNFISNYITSGGDRSSGGAIFNSKTIDDISGNFIGNYANASGGAIYNVENATIGDIIGDFIRNEADGFCTYGGDECGGGAIANDGIIGNITGYFMANVASDYCGGAVVNSGFIDAIAGNFIENYVENNSQVHGGAIGNYEQYDSDATIGDITGNFIGNYVDGSCSERYCYARGGAIDNNGTIGAITGDFIGNYAHGYSNVRGGAIYNYNYNGSATIGDITGDFIENHAMNESSSAEGGAIFNQFGRFNITGNFIGNYAQSGNSQAYGGAILSTIGWDLNTMEVTTSSVSSRGQDIFLSGNYTEDIRGKIYNALHVMILTEEFLDAMRLPISIPADAVDFAFDTSGGGSITINDNIDGSLTDNNGMTDDRSAQYNLAFRGDDTLDGDGRTTQYIAINNDIINASKVTVKGTTLKFGSYDHQDENAKNSSGHGRFVATLNADGTADLDVAAVTSLSLTNAAFDLYNGYTETVNLKGWSASNSYLHVDVDVAAGTADVLNIAGDVVGQTKVIIYADSEEVTDKSILFATATGEAEQDANAFSVYRVYNSPYMFDVAYNPDGENGKEWSLAMTDEENENAGILPDPIGTPEVPDVDVPDIDIPDINIPTAPVYGEVVAYGALPAAALEQTRNMVDNIGGQVAATRTQDAAANYNLWVNPTYYTSNIDSPFAIDADIWGIEAGGDIQRDVHNRLGIFVSYRQGEYDMNGNGDKYRSPVGSEIDIDSYIAGLYYRYDHNNWYAFATLYGGIQEADIKTDDGMKSDTDGVEFGASAEVGYDYALTDSVTLTPELGVFYTQVNYDDAEDNVGKSASYDDARQIELEAGVKLAKTFMTDESFASVYVKPSVVQTIVDGDEVNITGLGDVEALDDATLGRIEIGGRYGFTTNLSAYGWANYTFGSDYDATTFGLGLNYAF